MLPSALAPIADARHLHRHRPDPGHHLALGQEPVAHKPLATFLVQQMRVLGDERRHLSLDRRAKQLLRASLDHLGQRIRRKFRWQFERDNSRFGHGGISFLFETDGVFNTAMICRLLQAITNFRA